MKTTTSKAVGGALYKRRVCLSISCLIIVTLWNTHSVTAAPAKFDSLDSTFPLDLQPPVFEATSSASSTSQPYGQSDGTTTIDSYGNPIESLQPIQTPDGRKVVSAQGLQFEIPNYASGITEIKKPADDLLPPFIGEFSNAFVISTSEDSVDDVGQRNDDKPGIRINNRDNSKADDSLVHDNNFLTSDAYVSDQLQDIRRYKRQLQYTTDSNKNHNNNINYNNNFETLLKDKVFKTQNMNTNNVANTMTIPSITLDGKLTTNAPSYNLENTSIWFENNLLKNFSNLKFNSLTNISLLSPSSSPQQYSNSFQSPSSKTKLSAHFTPISNGNFNYPNVPKDPSIVDRIVSKYKNPLPTLDPIVVALPNTSPESFSTNPGLISSGETTSVHVESVSLVEVKSQPAATHSVTSLSKDLPDYILELNDPDIAGPVDYEPSKDKRVLNIIAWDLLPPLKEEDSVDKSISHNNKVTVTTGHNSNAQASQESSHSTQRPQPSLRTSKETTTIPTYTQNRGGVFYTSTTATPSRVPKTTTTKASTTSRTTTTARGITTFKATTSTTRRSTTPRTTTSRTTISRTTTPRTTTTTPEPDSSEFFKLEAGNSYTLPPWLQDIDDPDLDVAVEFDVPEDINEYNHTIERDLSLPLEPFTDLKNIHLTSPPSVKDISTTPKPKLITTATVATTTTTTRRPTSSTAQPHWVRVRPTTSKPTIATFNNQFTSLSPSISSSNFAQRTTSTTRTTTVKPRTTINYYNRQFSSNNPHTDKIGSSGEEDKPKSNNPFLSAVDDGKYKPQLTSRRTTTSTTTTTTTTTPRPEIIEKNPFAATIPPWLKDFDYPDLGPGVPFIYDPNEDENPVDENILPPSKIEDSNKTNPSSTFAFFNSQTPQAFKNVFTSSSIPLIASSSIPSIVTIPLPSTQKNQDDSKLTQPPHVFLPPTHISAEDTINADKKTSSTFNKNFAAPFDSATATTATASTATDVDQKKVPLSADRESFPPFNTSPSKTTFSKSEDGKVITNNMFLSSGIGSTSIKTTGSSQAASSEEKSTFTTQSSTGSTLTTSAAASGFVTVSASSSIVGSSSIDGSKYTGRFGGPPGVLAPQVNGFTASSATVTKSYSKPTATTGTTSSPALTTNNNKFIGSFGGPPGVLKPYDNVKIR